MSGIDEQKQTFKCSDCNKLEYWMLDGWSFDAGRRLPLAHLNKMNEDGIVILKAMSRIKYWYLTTFLSHIDMVRCNECGNKLRLDGIKYKEIVDKIKEVWEDRVFA